MSERRDYIGGAAVSGIMGRSPWSSPWREWALLVGLAPETPDNDRFAIGRALEPAISTLFTRDTGLVVDGEQMELRHHDHPYLRGHIDGLVMDGHGEADVANALGLLEAKSAGGAPWAEVPEQYLLQGQFYLLLSGLERIWFAVLFGGFGLAYRTYEVGADAAMQADIEAACVDFWRSHVVTGDPPPVDGSEATTDLIRALFPDHTPGESVEVDAGDVAELSAQREYRLSLERSAKAAKEREREVENRLRIAMGAAEVATVDGAPVLTCRTQTRTTADLDALRADWPDAWEATKREASTRVMRPAPKGKR